MIYENSSDTSKENDINESKKVSFKENIKRNVGVGTAIK